MAASRRKAAQSLKATHVVDGSIRRGGNKVRIAAHLTEAATQTTLWSDRYDRDLDDIFAVQDEISEAIATALDTAFFRRRKTSIDPGVYDLYLQCRGVLHTNPDTLRTCIPILETATRQAPDFADAWGLLAFMRSWLVMNLPFGEREPVARMIREEVARCRALDADSAFVALAEWGLVAPFGDFLTSDRIIQRVVETGGRTPEAIGLLAHWMEGVGRVREGADHGLRLQELDRLNPMAHITRGQILWRSGRFAEGRDGMERAVANFPDDHHTAITLIIACAHQGDWAAVDALTDPARLAKYPLREHAGVLRLIEVMRDPTAENRQRLLGAVRKRVETTGHADAAPALYLAHLGYVDETYDLLDRAKLGPAGSPRDQLGPNAYRTHLLFPAAFPELRADPRFVKLCARLGLVEYWLTTQKWPDCADVVPYDFRSECERFRDYPKDVFFALPTRPTFLLTCAAGIAA